MRRPTSRSLRAAVAGLLVAALGGLALAASDVPATKPLQPPPASVDTSPRCLPAAVNECRAACTAKRYDTSDKLELGRRQEQCRQDCIKGC